MYMLPTCKGRYPNIKFDLMITDQFIDLVAEGVDLAIRVGNWEDSSLIARVSNYY